MEAVHFIFWESLKVISLAFLGLLGTKAVSNLRLAHRLEASPRLNLTQGILYALIAVLCALGSWNVGFNIAAEVYFWAGESYMSKGQADRAYLDAVRAVELRPGSLQYWRALAQAKLSALQFESLLADMPAFREVSGGVLDESDEYRFALCHFYLGHHDQVLDMTGHLIAQNRDFAAPYVLRGASLTAEKRYPEAERTLLSVLQIHPTNQAAVEGLAHVYFLMGQRGRAVAVLDQTAKFPFPLDARKRFEALKGLYAQ